MGLFDNKDVVEQILEEFEASKQEIIEAYDRDEITNPEWTGQLNPAILHDLNNRLKIGQLTEEEHKTEIVNQLLKLRRVDAYASFARHHATASRDWYKAAGVISVIAAGASAGFIPPWGPLAFGGLTAWMAYDYFTAGGEVEKAIRQGRFYRYLPSDLQPEMARDLPGFVPPKERARLEKQKELTDELLDPYDNDYKEWDRKLAAAEAEAKKKGYQPPTEPAKAEDLLKMTPAERAKLDKQRGENFGKIVEFEQAQHEAGHSLGQRLAAVPTQFAQGLVQSMPVQQTQPQINFDDGSEYAWTDELLAHNAIALWGSQGGGKTSKAAWILTKRVEQGAFAAVLDPFAAAGKWQGLTVFGRGLNFSEVEKALVRFTNEARRRIKERAFNENYNPFNDVHWHFMLDEMTNWEKKINPAVMGDFVDVCSQNLRQCNMSATCCTHGKTMTCFGGQEATKGKADVLKRQFLWIQVLPTTDLSVPGNLRCSGEAIVSHEDGDQKVKVPEWMQAPPNFDYRPYNPIQIQQPAPAPQPAYTVVSQAPETPNSYQPAQVTIQQSEEDKVAYRPDWWGDKSYRLMQWNACNGFAKEGLSRSNIIKKMTDYKSVYYPGFQAALDELEQEFGRLSNS